MDIRKTDIYVYADWQGLPKPTFMGILTAHNAKGKKSFSFTYDNDWLKSQHRFIIDPDIQFFSGVQFPYGKENFGIFWDSMPDTWGKTLMKRKEIQRANSFNEKPRTLYEIDYLLGVYDKTRMGGLRFKLDKKGKFLDDSDENPTPPWASVRTLQEASRQLENDKTSTLTEKWLDVLMAPGSSLGGARPKANVLDQDNNLWIAKFPAKNDMIDKGLWEHLAHILAQKSGVIMADCKVQKIAGKYHTFFTKRFDRKQDQRIHFASAMTMTGNSEQILKERVPSYLELAEFIQNYGAEINEDLHQLWRRIVFNIAVSNTDDHLRNHGFILTEKGWRLSPAYDINPSTDKNGLALNIDMDNNALDFELAKSVGKFFRLENLMMASIIDDIIEAVLSWKTQAKSLGISHNEIELMQTAFRV